LFKTVCSLQKECDGLLQKCAGMSLGGVKARWWKSWQRGCVYCVAGWQKNPPANIIISQPDSQPLLSSSQLFIHKTQSKIVAKYNIY
jgi:hypothetical protein